MLKLFFDRYSKIVLLMEIMGVAFTLAWIYKLAQSPDPSRLISILLAIYSVEYVLLRFCASRRLYKNAKRYEGVELHFKKGMIPTSYGMALASLLGFWTGSTILLWVMIFVMGILLYANFTLLYLHCKDKSKTPVNYYSNKKFMS
ncbi:MAG: hypothetical protein Q7T03_01585 [Deltaproteobacteria bacterium]|nr:hypothetical protein [Deltaproteobacteria bacterium]